MASSSPFTVMTNIFVMNLLNSVKTFRKNSIVFFDSLKLSTNDLYVSGTQETFSCSACKLHGKVINLFTEVTQTIVDSVFNEN